MQVVFSRRFGSALRPQQTVRPATAVLLLSSCSFYRYQPSTTSPSSAPPLAPPAPPPQPGIGCISDHHAYQPVSLRFTDNPSAPCGSLSSASSSASCVAGHVQSYVCGHQHNVPPAPPPLPPSGVQVMNRSQSQFVQHPPPVCVNPDSPHTSVHPYPATTWFAGWLSCPCATFSSCVR